jgi:hypothetical protein
MSDMFYCGFWMILDDDFGGFWWFASTWGYVSKPTGTNMLTWGCMGRFEQHMHGAIRYRNHKLGNSILVWQDQTLWVPNSSHNPIRDILASLFQTIAFQPCPIRSFNDLGLSEPQTTSPSLVVSPFQVVINYPDQLIIMLHLSIIT